MSIFLNISASSLEVLLFHVPCMEHLFNIADADSPLIEEHRQMVKYVCGFVCQLFFIAVLRSDHSLEAFFAVTSLLSCQSLL